MSLLVGHHVVYDGVFLRTFLDEKQAFTYAIAFDVAMMTNGLPWSDRRSESLHAVLALIVEAETVDELRTLYDETLGELGMKEASKFMVESTEMITRFENDGAAKKAGEKDASEFLKKPA